VRKFIKRHPFLAYAVVFIVWDLPQWLASVWSLISANPIIKSLSYTLQKREIALPHFSPYWITTALALAMAGMIMREVRRRPLPKELPTLDSLDDMELHRQAANWLAASLSDKKLCIQRAILFGSVVHDNYATTDVDVIIFGKPMSDRKLKRVGRKLKGEMGEQFKERFGHRLHLQLYTAMEKERMEAFLKGLSKYEELRLENRQ